MDVPAGMPGQPRLHSRMLMGAVVVDDQMDVELLGNALVDAPPEGEELLMAVARLASGEHGAAQHIQRGKECRGAVPLVIVCNAFNVAEPQRQHRLGALERPTLALLVHAHH